MLLGGLPLLALSVAREGDVLLERLPQLTGMQLFALLPSHQPLNTIAFGSIPGQPGSVLAVQLVQ
jgi:hypothetical protein